MKWVEALRSGKYKQGEPGVLKCDNGYCCLGVLCEINSQEFKKTTNGYSLYGFSNIIPDRIKNLVNMKHSLGRIDELGDSLARLNDDGIFVSNSLIPERLTFDELADLIKINYKDL